MAAHVRRLLTFTCEGEALAGSLDEAAGTAGLLFVTGGTQTRIGSHRMFERLALALAAAGHPCFRFDRRGVGDSEGEDPGFRGSGPDLAAAAAAFRRQCPGIERLIGLGLCDGATALALNGAASGLDGLVLINPWLVEAEAGAPPAAAIKRHYARQLLSLGGWKKILSGAVSYRKLFSGLRKIVSPPRQGLAGDVAAALERDRLPFELILARDDATAIAAEAEWRRPAFARLRRAHREPSFVESDSHTFARPGDREELERVCLAALDRLSGGG
jgi:exosortase A-associated hydrolase 1